MCVCRGVARKQNGVVVSGDRMERAVKWVIT